MNDFMQSMLPTLATILGTVLTALAGYAITYINKKNKDLQANTDSATAKKYMDMINKTITDSVLRVSQVYVEALKKNNAFTAEAQKEAFNMAYNNVMNILSDDAIEYLNEITKDATEYISTKIEAEVKLSK